jgi:hypothetical protein
VLVAEVVEVGEVEVEALVAKVLEDAGERMLGAELLVADGGEIEEVVPGAAGVLQLFEAFGHGGGLRTGHAFALVAGTLGGLAQIVQVLLALLARAEHAFHAALDGGEQIVDGDLKLFGGLECGEELFGVAREFGEMLLDGGEELALAALTIFADSFAEFVLGLAQVGGSFDGGTQRVVFVLEELVLHVAVADPAGDAAKFFEAAVDALRCGLIGREAFDGCEELELGLDAASGRAEFVDGLGGGGRNSYRQRGLQAFGLFAQLFHGSCRE